MDINAKVWIADRNGVGSLVTRPLQKKKKKEKKTHQFDWMTEEAKVDTMPVYKLVVRSFKVKNQQWHRCVNYEPLFIWF